MDKLVTAVGTAIPLPRTAVDTDQIMPARFMKRITKTGYDDALFHDLRGDDDFVLNQAWAKGATVLFAGPDFGTGSSREHAVWALRDYGFTAVFSSRFADIFRGNAGKQGLLAGVLSEPDMARCWAAIDEQPGVPARVDLRSCNVAVGGVSARFEIDAYTRWRLLEGLDDISLTLRAEHRIAEFEGQREPWLPTTLPPRT